jgi:tetratricopeptide (TPR) repeat protein
MTSAAWRAGAGIAAAFAFAASLLVAGAAQAEPSLWQRAENPSRARVERILRRVSRYVDWVSEADGDPDMRHDFWLGALVTLEQSGAQAFRDPRLRLLLAEVLIGAELGREAEAAALARAVLAETPRDGAWLEAEARLVLVLAVIEPEAAVREIGRALPWVWDSRTRSDLFRRRADAKMALGDVRGALSDYRLALRADDSARRSALARFGIGLALERAGNLPEALAELRLARLSAPRVFGVELGVLALPGVFAFRPADVHYVVALAERSLIPNPVDPDSDAATCDRAIAAFREYIAGVRAEDPFIERSRRHLAEVTTRCEQLRARQKASPAEPEL